MAENTSGKPLILNIFTVYFPYIIILWRNDS